VESPGATLCDTEEVGDDDSLTEGLAVISSEGLAEIFSESGVSLGLSETTCSKVGLGDSEAGEIEVEGNVELLDPDGDGDIVGKPVGIPLDCVDGEREGVLDGSGDPGMEG